MNATGQRVVVVSVHVEVVELQTTAIIEGEVDLIDGESVGIVIVSHRILALRPRLQPVAQLRSLRTRLLDSDEHQLFPTNTLILGFEFAY
jgi:hypothetical protein